MFFKCIPGEARVSSGGAAVSVRPSLKTFLVFLLSPYVKQSGLKVGLFSVRGASVRA